MDEVLEKNPDIVILLLGGNDYLRQIPQEETFLNLGKIISMLEEKGAVVVLLGVRGGILGDHFEEQYKELSKKYHTAYISNVLEDILFNRERMSDGVHPNDRGYAVIAERVTPLLQKLLVEAPQTF
jgi:lysophospholipase L1-like esterase